MQEGLFSLSRWSKTTEALTQLERASSRSSPSSRSDHGRLSASFAMIGVRGHRRAAALIGFAGPRVIEQTVPREAPEGFQRAEFLLEKGRDMIVDRRRCATRASVSRNSEVREALTLSAGKLDRSNAAHSAHRPRESSKAARARVAQEMRRVYSPTL